jgi:eukaryotic-like serine/threonine-protein kinase
VYTAAVPGVIASARGPGRIITRPVALTLGTRLGRYEIVSAIGSGGMGEVYRATDSNLKRAVAIKVLPAAVAGDADRLARFRREAEVLAALNHPNVAAIYGLEKTPAFTALVMELIEGEDLSQRIARGPIPIDDALPIAKQIADALEAAHEQGIIHRDLKPANIKVRADSTVKVLDFGLAKALVADASSVGARNHTISPTITSPAMMTGAGMILGTAPYMAPEQARGDAVDRRTDIWAFGCVLFEMLTGRVAFGAATVTETLAKILEGHPDLNALPATTPPALRRLLRRCLERSTRSRLQHIGDARADIADILSGELAAEGARSVRAATKMWWLGAVALSIASAIVLTWQVGGGSAANTDELRVAIMPPARSLPYEFALAPDGRHIVFVASADRRRSLWLRSLDNETITQLPGTEDADHPFWSADSKSIGYFASGTLRRIDIAGGPSITLARAPLGRGGSWNGDGTIVFSPTGEGLVRMRAGGEPIALTHLSPPSQTGHWWPQFLPDGQHFLFFVNGTQAGVYLGSVDGAMPRRLMSSDTAAAYLPPDVIAFARQGVLVGRHFDSRTYEVSGPERVIADAVGADATSRLGGFSVSANGRIAYQSAQALPVELAAFDRSGRPLGVLIGDRDGDRLANPELSPKDLRVAVTLMVDNNVDVWLRDLQGGPLTRLTTDDDADGFPIWSPDARLIAFTSNRTRQIYVKPSSGLGKEELLLDTTPAAPEDWSRDNRYVLYRTFEQKNADLWALDRFAKPPARLPVATSSFDERNGRESDRKTSLRPRQLLIDHADECFVRLRA